MQFKDVIGQSAVKQRLIKSVRENHVSHAQLFLGPAGSGKLPLALAYAQYILCPNRTETDSCGVCPTCQKMQKLVHPDLHFVVPTAATKKIKSNPDIKKNNNIGMFILGKNLFFENNYDFYEKMLFELCGKFPDYRPYKKKEDITEKERANLNYINLTRPLPQGWSLEGPVVVDDKDEIHYEHPYLEQFIDEYIDLNNKAIDQYNNNVKKQIEDLLI